MRTIFPMKQNAGKNDEQKKFATDEDDDRTAKSTENFKKVSNLFRFLGWVIFAIIYGSVKLPLICQVLFRGCSNGFKVVHNPLANLHRSYRHVKVTDYPKNGKWCFEESHIRNSIQKSC